MEQERLRVSRFEADGLPFVDIRYWKDTKNGPRSTKRGIVIRQDTVTHLISALQTVHQQYNAETAKRAAMARS